MFSKPRTFGGRRVSSLLIPIYISFLVKTSYSVIQYLTVSQIINQNNGQKFTFLAKLF